MRNPFEKAPAAPEGGEKRPRKETTEEVLELSEKKGKEELKTKEEILSEAREKFARIELKAADKLKKFKKADLEKSAEDIRGYKGAKREYLRALKGQRADLYEEALEEIEKTGVSEEEAGELMRQKIEEIIKKTVVAEASSLYDAKTRLALEAKGDKKFTERAWKTAGRVVDWYRKLPLKYKIAAAGALGIGGVAVGMAGGAAPGAAVAGLFVGRTVQRLFGAGATAVAVEAGWRRHQEKKAEKKTLKEFGDQLTELLKNNDKSLDERLLELEGRKKSEKTKRYILAGTAGAIIASGLLGRAIRWGIQETGIGRSIKEAVKETVSGLTEQKPPSAAENLAYEAAKGGPEIAAKGDSVWKIISRQMSDRYGEKFNNLDEARKTYLIDALKDKVAANPEKFGLSDIDQIQTGKTYDFLPGSDAEIEEAFKAAKTIKENVASQILEHNRAIEDWTKSHPAQSLTSEKIDEILLGEESRITNIEKGEMAGAEPTPEVKSSGVEMREAMNYNERAQVRAIGYTRSEYQAVKNTRVSDFLREFPPQYQAWDEWRMNPDYYRYGPSEFNHHTRAAEIIRGYNPHYRFERAGQIIRGHRPYRYMTVGRFFQIYGPKQIPMPPSPPFPPPPFPPPPPPPFPSPPFGKPF